jgi:hypothetical protein
LKRENSGSGNGSMAANAAPGAPKAKSNPIGGGSAFSWLNPGGGPK